MARTTSSTTDRSRSRRRPPGSWGTVEQLPSGRWRAYYRHEGRRFGAPHSFATKDDANAWLATERADRARGTWHDPLAGQVTVAEYATTWLASRPDLAPRTRDLYQRTLTRWVLPRVGGGRGIELGNLLVGNLNPTIVRSWYAAMFATPKERASTQLTRAAAPREHPARTWARSQGKRIATAGRLSPVLLSEWEAAGEPLVDMAPVPAPHGAGRTAASHAYRLLRTILNTAVLDGALPSNPCQIPSAGTVHHRERPTASPAEVDQIAAHMPPDFAAAVLVAAWSSLRYGH